MAIPKRSEIAPIFFYGGQAWLCPCLIVQRLWATIGLVTVGVAVSIYLLQECQYEQKY